MGAVIIIAGVVLQSFAKNLAMFASARAIIGMGLSFEYTAAPLLVSELIELLRRRPPLSDVEEEVDAVMETSSLDDSPDVRGCPAGSLDEGGKGMTS